MATSPVVAIGKISKTLRALGAIGWLAWLFGPVAAWAQPESLAVAMPPASWQADAELHAVCFVDRLTGWAVGDRGVIWHTNDGGLNWAFQPSGISHRLRAVHFVDARNGWVVGGNYHSLANSSSGVILRTTDGGQHWSRVSADTLPMLHAIYFDDTSHGWVAGEPSPLYGSGLFRSSDRGRSWSSVSGTAKGPWIDGATTTGAGFACGREGQVGQFSGSRLVATTSIGSQLASLRGGVTCADGQGWLVGDGGALYCSYPPFANWREVDLSAILPQVNQVDWRSVTSVGSEIWIAGAPGGVVLHSSDQGEEWELLRTGQSLPLNSITFIDSRHGWAVGAMGTILSTDDSGATWTICRQAASRVALLGIFVEPHEVSLELVAATSAADRYYSAVYCASRRDVEIRRPYAVDDAFRLADAVSAVGGSATEVDWRFPQRQPGLNLSAESLLALWQGEDSSSGDALLCERIALQIRQWRPAVVVTTLPSADDPPIATLLYEAVVTACQQAGARGAWPNHQTELGLAPWSVERLVALDSHAEQREVLIGTTVLVPSHGTSAADLAARASGWLNEDHLSAKQLLTGQIIRSSPGEGGVARGRDLFTGIALGQTDAIGRPEATLSATSIDALHQQVQSQRRIYQFVEQLEGLQPATAEAMWSQLAGQAMDMEPIAAGWSLARIALALQEQGHGRLAVAIWDSLQANYPSHPAAVVARRQLLQMHASGEQRWRARLAGDLEFVEQADQRTVALGQQIQASNPALLANPALQFGLVRAELRQGDLVAVQGYLQGLIAGQGDPLWQEVALCESRLEEAPERLPRPQVRCAPCTQRPYLDGLLDETCWQQAEPLRLQSSMGDDAQWPAVVLLSCDEEYLYLGASMRRPSPWVNGQAGAESVEGREGETPLRERDADLSGHDRIDLLIDVDRDWASYWRLTIDDRGWTVDAMNHDLSWNPNWYVATTRNEQEWTVEAAIPLAAIASEELRREPWALGVQRTVPGVGFQSWTATAAIEPIPSGFGLLRWDEE